MNVIDCIQSRRSIRKFKQQSIDHSLIDSIVSIASYSPSWKNTQITRYIAIEDSSILSQISGRFTYEHNSNIIKQAAMLIAITFKKGQSGFESDGSFTTEKQDQWQMFDAGIACQTFCLAAHEHGLGTVIMGIFQEKEIAGLLKLPEDEQLAALIAIGKPDETPHMPPRKAVTELLTYR